MRILIIAALAAVLAVPEAASAHPGGLNSEGCHNNRKTGDYHCHRGSQNRAAPARPQGLTGNGSGSRSAGAFANCTAARAAGAAPVRRGDSGYGPHLDRDGDSVGCER